MKKYRMMAALCVAFLLTISFSTVAYAGGEEPTPEPTETPAPEPIAAPNPFTPAGTGTVVDNATDEDGKEFFTIMTPNENVFYLVIDRQREQENVYFLNAVTEKDLLALAEQSEEPEEVAPTPPVTTEPTPEPIPEPTPEPEKGGNMGMMIFVALAVLVGGGAGYYFKIYRPKQEQAVSADDDYNEYEDDPYGEQEDDTPPWDTDESTGEDEE
ncbi:DUF4366 domain-containing protein [Faecalicatena contorta]|uniref:Mobile element protein CD1107-like domain-containing protein n=1 Tax=Faecalicatena contorta TaxID=39482 RepID=A0A316A199_9FIRM|nr:DUF4366 domain-containing protein [Faecalicatena contorta]PWJ50840.1 uncharacterized protein DUF4366 [Faecalicatena contorta]SUQ13408.1 protein of unknown function [Faecalicatena contorta]